MKKHRYIIFVITLSVTLQFCKKSDTVPTAPVNDYLPMQPGKYIHYRLDSTLYVNFGQKDTTIYYDAKDVVDAEITDNLGRPAFRIVRYLRDTLSTNEGDYSASMSYVVTPSREGVDVTENNLRFQKLKLPVTEAFTWRGNTYLPTAPYFDLYQFSNDEDIDKWDYTYQNVNQSAEVNGNFYDSTVTVLQQADSANVPIEFSDALAYRNYWVEQYSKNIGLVYKEVVMWEYQPPAAGNPGFISGFGLKMRIIDHN
ncbi:MAG: hypothetical protein ABI415_08730 [Flavitalea sp.]